MEGENQGNQLQLLKEKLASYQIDQKTDQEMPTKKAEALIEPKPSLRHITKAAKILRAPIEVQEGPEQTKKVRWTELSQNVNDFDSTLDLSEKIRNVVRDFVVQKIPDLKSAIPAFGDLSDAAILNALTHNWFESIYNEHPQIAGQRREVLLTVIAGIVKRMETKVYKDVIARASEGQLKTLGIDANTQDLLVDLLDISMKADPLFVRFLAFSNETGKPGKEASENALTMPDKEGTYTLHELFPKETQVLSMRFRDLADKSLLWSNHPGADTFKQYLSVLSEYYGTTDKKKAAECQEKLLALYAQTVAEGFPIVLTPSIEQTLKEPYYEPDLKVSLIVPETSGEDKAFKDAYRRMQKGMSESLYVLGMEKYGKKLDPDLVRVLVSLGVYGSNLAQAPVAQEGGITALFLNEQIRAYDRDFPAVMNSLIANSEQIFANVPPEQRTKMQENMSRLDSLMHEYAHPVIHYKSKGAKRLGDEPLTIIDEVKAEIVHKALIPSMVEKGALDGTTEQWALATLTSSCQMLKDQTEDDPYFAAAVYSLNSLFKSGAVAFDGNKITVNSYQMLFDQLKLKAEEVLHLYQDKSMNKTKANAWIQAECKPNEQVAALMKFLKKKE